MGHDSTTQIAEKAAGTSLSPLPAHDVDVCNLTIEPPVHRATIPTPIPIAVPASVTRLFRRPSPEAFAITSIVRQVEVHVRSGEVLAIIGGSGSGKTTVLHAIAGRLAGLRITDGGVHVSRRDGRSVKLAKALGFVRQNDYLLPCLTVRETLHYAAALRLPASTTAEARRTVVEATIAELGLGEVADVVVGGRSRKGISGGEARRLTIGCVLVTRPSIVVLDEPTTGLDAFTAYQLLVTLQRLARSGRTVIFSVHQPRSDAFQCFDQLLLLSKGNVVYSGARDSCLDHFDRLGHQPPPFSNPLDWLIDLSHVEGGDDEGAQVDAQRVQKLVAVWRSEADETGTRPIVAHASSTAVDGPVTSDEKRPNIFAQSLILTQRASRNALRAYPELAGQLVQAVAIGVATGVIFLRLGGQPSDIRSLQTLCFQSGPGFFYLTQVFWLYRWTQTLVVFDREQDDHLYSAVAWVASEFIANTPINVIVPSIYGILVYFMANMRQDNLSYNLGVFIAQNIVAQFCWVYVSLFAASIDRSFARASLILNATAIFAILSPGFFVVPAPGWIRWYRWLSPYFYSFRITVISQFRSRTFACASNPGGPPTPLCDGNAALASLGISADQPIWPMFFGLLGFVIVVTSLSSLLLTVYKPGGVRHAAKLGKSGKGKEVADLDIEVPTTSVDVSLVDVGLQLTSGRISGSKSKTILHDVNARFDRGELTVIMGPSGSGKSSLLQLCSGRRLVAGVASSFTSFGTITLNNEPLSSRTRRLAELVPQSDDWLLAALTPRETLRYAAALKLPAHLPRKRKHARAEEVLRMLGLLECADTAVGGELVKGISGGEKRRLALGVQMIGEPAVLFADEPTSGLDAHIALEVAQTLKRIASGGRTVVVTLHQPRSDIWQLADKLLILAKGRTVFHGTRDELLAHLALEGHICPEHSNPADFVADLISIDYTSTEAQETTTKRVDRLIERWAAHDRKRLSIESANAEAPRSPSPSTPIKAESASRAPFWVALPVIFDRSFHNFWRQPDKFWSRLIQAPILGICFYVFFLRLDLGPSGAQNRIGLVAESTSALNFVGLLNAILFCPAEKAIFVQDYKSASGRYSALTFVTSFSLLAVLPEFISAILYCVIMLIGTGIRHDARTFWQASLAIWAQLSFGESCALMLTSLFDSEGLAISIVSVLLTIASLAGSVFSASIWVVLQDIAYIFPMRWAARILLINEMQGLTFDCSGPTPCTAATGQQVLDLFSFSGNTAVFSGILVGITFGWRIVAWLFIAVRMRFV